MIRMIVTWNDFIFSLSKIIYAMQIEVLAHAYGLICIWSTVDTEIMWFLDDH